VRSRLKPGAALLFAALAAAAVAGAQPQVKSDWEREQEARDWREGDFVLPAYPKAPELLPFQVSAAHSFRFYIDGASLSVGKDGVVRYILIARSPSGAENVSVEGIRCQAGTVRTYAFGQRDGRWSERGTDWRPIDRTGGQRWHYTLWREYFCPHAIAIRDPAEGVDALRRGGHPDAPRADDFGR
jgi:hypothetical protein